MSKRMELRNQLDALTAVVAAAQQHAATGFQTALAAAVDAARAKVPSGRAVSDDELRLQVRPLVLNKFTTEQQQKITAARELAQGVRSILGVMIDLIRVPASPAAPSGASAVERQAFSSEHVALWLEFPHGVPLEELWRAFIAADGKSLGPRAAFLELRVNHELEKAPTGAGNPLAAARALTTRARIRQELDAIRDQRLVAADADGGNLAAWQREIDGLDATISALGRTLFASNRRSA